MRFSVYIPVWNGARWLDGAIESLLGQTYQDWELVIGDNASTDGTDAVAARHRDPRIRYHRWLEFVEISENYNRTLLLAKGEWLQLLGVDDRLHPRCLERMAERIEGEVSWENETPSLILPLKGEGSRIIRRQSIVLLSGVELVSP